MTDEVYEHLVFSGQHQPMAALPGMRDRTLTISSLGKTFRSPVEIGWVVGAAPLSAAVGRPTSSSPSRRPPLSSTGRWPPWPRLPCTTPTCSQRIGGGAICLVEGLTRVGFGVTAPAGTYFVCADIRPLGYTDDVAFCRMLAERVGVAAIPPSVFYDVSQEGKSYVRFAFCKREETLREAVSRLEKLRRA